MRIAAAYCFEQCAANRLLSLALRHTRSINEMNASKDTPNQMCSE